MIAAITDVRHWLRIREDCPFRPIWPDSRQATKTCHTDSSLTHWGATIAEGTTGPGEAGYYEVHGHWEASLQRTSHITLLELRAVREALSQFSSHLKRDEVLQLFTDNKVVYYVINQWLSRSPAVMKELRILHRYLWTRGITLKVEHLPSALNLYADRLSRHRKSYDYFPALAGVQESSYVGASDHDWSKPWPRLDEVAKLPGPPPIIRPPLEYLPVCPKKVEQDGYDGLMLVPYWTRRSWWKELADRASEVFVLHPHADDRKWKAALLAFSPIAAQFGEQLVEAAPNSRQLSWQRPKLQLDRAVPLRERRAPGC